MNNTTDSLIDLTLKALKGAYEILLYNFEAIPTSGETVTTNVRPVFNDICEAVARLEMSMDCGSCSEISGNEDIHSAIRNALRLPLGSYRIGDVIASPFLYGEAKVLEDNAVAVYNAIRPYLRTTEPGEDLLLQRFQDGKRLGIIETEDRLRKPVSVSLAKCVDALQKVCFADTHGGFNHESQTKAVLDAAEVKYVE